MRWSRLLRALVDSSPSEGQPHAVHKAIRINGAIAVNDEPGASATASAVQDSPVTQTRRA